MRFLLLSFVFILAGCFDDAEDNSAAEAKPRIEAELPGPAEVSTTDEKQPSIIIDPNMPVTEAICKSKEFPATMNVNTNGHTYANVCRLKQLSGITITGVDKIYLCQSELFQEGFTHGGEHFPIAQVKQALGESADKSDILASYGFIGKRFALLLLENSEGTKIVATREELGSYDVTLETEEAALAWAYFSGALGRGMASGFAPEAMCGAKIIAHNGGWLLSNAETFQNCQPKELRDIQIGKKGQISILQKTVKKDSAALCID